MRALITLSMTIDVDSVEDLAGMGEKMEDLARESFEENLAAHGCDVEDLDGVFHFYGVAITVQRELA